MLKFRIAKLEDVSEAHRDLYSKQEDGSYVLMVEGAVGKDRLDEFRNSNIELTKRLDALKDVDPAKYQELLDLDRKAKEGELIKKGDVEGLVNLRVSTMKADYEGKLGDLTKNYETATRQLEVLTIDNVVRENAIKLGVAPTAVDDVLLRAKTTFRVESGKPTAKDSSGNVIYGKDGQNPLSVGEWLGGLKTDAPHLFQQSSGSGSQNRHGPGNSGGTPMTASQKIAEGLRNGSPHLQ